MVLLHRQRRSRVVGMVLWKHLQCHCSHCGHVVCVDASAKVRWNHRRCSRCLIFRQRLESTPLVLQLCQRLDARLLNTYTSTYTSPRPLRRVVAGARRRLWTRWAPNGVAATAAAVATAVAVARAPPPSAAPAARALCQRCPWAWLDQLCGCLSRQQLRQRLEHFFCCLSRQLDHLFCCLSR